MGALTNPWVWLAAVLLVILAGIMPSCDPHPGLNIIRTPTSINITGPHLVNSGPANNYNLEIKFDAPLHKTYPMTVVAEIYEDDWTGDVLLTKSVNVVIPAGETSGKATFTLRCWDARSDGNLVVSGRNGSQSFDSPWKIFGYVPNQGTAYAKEGDNFELRCD